MNITRLTFAMVRIFEDQDCKDSLEQNLRAFAELTLSMVAYRLRDNFKRIPITTNQKISNRTQKYPKAVLLALFPDRSKVQAIQQNIRAILIQRKTQTIEIIHNSLIDTEDIAALKQIIADVTFGHYFKLLPKAEELYRMNITNMTNPVSMDMDSAFFQLRTEEQQAISDQNAKQGCNEGKDIQIK